MARLRAHRRGAVMLARGSLGNPWRFERLLGRREAARTGRRSPASCVGDRPRRGAPRASSAPAATCASSTPGTRTRSGFTSGRAAARERPRHGRSTGGARRSDARRGADRPRCPRVAATPLGGGRVATLADPSDLCQLLPKAMDGGFFYGPRDRPHPGRPRGAQGQDRAPLDRPAAGGGRADQGGARVRRHLRELGVRRRQERAGDAREADRRARGQAPLRHGHRRGRASPPRWSRSARSCT